MATATLEFGQEAASGLNRPWWRRKDPYLLAAVCGPHVVAVGFAMRSIGSASWAGSNEALAGLIVAQCFLLAAWAALGGLGTVARWTAVTGVFACGLVGVAVNQQSYVANEYWSEILALGLMGATIVTGMAAAMVPLRGLAGWRLDFSAEPYRHIHNCRGQVGLLDFAALSCAVAAPLTAARLVNESAIWSAGDWPFFLTITALVALTAAPVAYAVVACRRAWLAIVVVASWPLCTAIAHSWLGHWQDELVFSGSVPSLAGLHLELVAFHTAVGLTMVVTLAPLRLFGLRLFVVGQSSREAEQTATRPPLRGGALRGFVAELKPRKAA